MIFVGKPLRGQVCVWRKHGRRWNDILEEGVKEGIFIETNPIILHFMLAGTMVFYNKTEALREKYGGLNERLADIDQKFPRSVNQEIERLVMRAVRVEGKN